MLGIYAIISLYPILSNRQPHEPDDDPVTGTEPAKGYAQNGWMGRRHPKPLLGKV